MLAYPSLLSDLDGTIIDTREIMNSAFDELCDRHVSTHKKLRALNVLHKSPKEALRLIGFDNLQRYWQAFAKNLDKARTFLNIESTLEELKYQDLTIGIVTSLPAKRANLLIEAVGIKLLISFVVGWEFTVPRKPNPHSIYKAINKLRNKNGVLYIGDSQDDIIAGKRAGISTGFVTWGYYSRKELIEKPDYFITTPSQLKDIITKS